MNPKDYFYLIESTSPEIHQVPEKVAPTRLADYAIGIFSHYPTKSSLKKAIKKKSITVDGETVTTAQIINGGEKIECAPAKDSEKKTLQLKLEVVYEDEYLAIIEKPAGILVSGNTFKTIDNALVQNLQRSPLPNACRPRPVHRLDFPTTGLLLIGKTTAAITTLNQLFEFKEVQKTYLAITIGNMGENGSIDLPIDGKAAQSFYKKLASVKSERFDCLNLLSLHPTTGRRHQLRKHLAAIGNEILGEREYGKKEFLLKGKGLYLHAFSLVFNHPLTNKEIRIQSEIPKKFLKIIGEDFSIEG